MKGWVCSHCKVKLPKLGLVWGHRYKKFRSEEMLLHPNNPSTESGYYCDDCKEALKAGKDLEDEN